MNNLLYISVVVVEHDSRLWKYQRSPRVLEPEHAEQGSARAEFIPSGRYDILRVVAGWRTHPNCHNCTKTKSIQRVTILQLRPT